ncbi:agamous-like MADS-box protein AGL61 [Lycium barbarum]|uniref:agamous-like MADS-box protein AGL61 n=1 Tax=Lycium barbarum TaxID=112863 RepID=UPI00293F0C3E|nr:agamous-like MADS-box protein AGL61 [Lycium barbarum]
MLRQSLSNVLSMLKSLSKKAKELSILCGIEIAVIIFSIGGQPFFFSKPDVESVVHQANQPSASSKRKVEESENKGKVTEGTFIHCPSEDFNLTDLERYKKLDQKFELQLVKEIVQLQSVIRSEDPQFVLEMNDASSSTLPSN